ncbi:MAG: chloride channel protein [Marmoricola sp.]
MFPTGRSKYLGLPVAAVLTGLAAGLAGVALTYALHAVQHVAFGYTENTFLVGVEKASHTRRVLALAIGGLLAGIAWWTFRRRSGAGIEDAISVRDAVRRGRRMPLLSTMLDALIQIFAVGVGGSLGREGAPRQAGAALAGEIAERFRLSERERRSLLASGAGAGLAAVYNVPLAGAAFTFEVLLFGVGIGLAVDALLTSLTASILATAVASGILGNKPVYALPGVSHLSLWLCVGALIVGLLGGVTGQLLVRLTRRSRERAQRGNTRRRTVVTITLSFTALGFLAIPAPDLLGNGKALAQLAFDGSFTAWAALGLALLKPAATAMCLRGGAIGGILTPAFATGATLGLAFAGFTHSSSEVRVALVLAGAAAVTATSQKAPITAILFAAELTASYGNVGVGRGVAVLIAVLAATATLRFRDAPSALLNLRK